MKIKLLVFVNGKGKFKNITREDLMRTSTVLMLFTQAVEVGWLTNTEANRLRFIAAAIRSKRVGVDPVKVFVAIVRRGLWHHITQQEEDQARASLVRYYSKRAVTESNARINDVVSELTRSLKAA